MPAIKPTIMTSGDEIEKVHGNGVHLVILGAGASVASTLRDPEPNGKVLPATNNIIDIVGLQDAVSRKQAEIFSLRKGNQSRLNPRRSKLGRCSP